MKIFLTGATGFVGSYLLKILLNHEHSVQILLRESSDTWRISGLLNHANCHTVYGSLADSHSYSKQVTLFKPDSIIHLGWQGVGNTQRNNSDQISNITQAIDLARLAVDLNIKSFIGLGSQAEYGPCENIISEQQSTYPTTLYGTAKLSTCLILENLLSQNNIRFAWLRLFSSYGPKDNENWLIPYLILSFLKNNPPELTKCEQLWDYIHVEDVASAIYSVLLSDKAHGIFNLGSGQAYKLKDIVMHIESKLNLSLNKNIKAKIGAIDYRPDQVMKLQADISKLQNMAAWQPQKDLYSGLSETIDWYSTMFNQSLTQPQ